MTTKKTDLLYKNFVGEYVEITTKMKIKTTATTEEIMTEQDTPVIVEAFILDYDDNFLYLGNTPKEVTSAVNRNEIVYLHITEEKELADMILDDMPMPDDDQVN